MACRFIRIQFRNKACSRKNQHPRRHPVTTPRTRPRAARQQGNYHPPTIQIHQPGSSSPSDRGGRGAKEKDHDPSSRPPHSRTPQTGQNHQKNQENHPVGRNEPIDCQLRQRMRDLPTKQDPNPLKEGPSISNHHYPRNTPIPAGSNGPDNGPSQVPREGCNPHNCRPQVLPSSSVHSLQHKHHWSGHCPAIPRTRIQMVRNTHQNNYQPRPTIHLSFWASPHPKTRS
jgi:hypothetical protein